jgi:hypothetical protein
MNMTINFSRDGDKTDIEVDSPTLEKLKKKRFYERVASILDSAFFALLLLSYIILSLVIRNPAPSGQNAWAVYWTILLLGDLPASTMRAIVYKKFTVFPIWSVCLFTYLFLGMYMNLWHPYWVILLGIPVYYCIFSPIDKLIEDKRKGRF